MKYIASALVGMLVLSSCAPAKTGTGNPALAQEDCTKERLTELNYTKNPNKLTIGVELPPIQPWFYEGDPTNGRGFESAMAYELAEALGYDKAEVSWIPQQFTEATSPGPKGWDMVINEFTVTPERERQVDFSEPYLFNYQTVVVLDKTVVARKLTPTLADVRKLKIGAQEGTTSFQAVRDLQPEKEPSVFSEHADVEIALRNGSIEAMVTDGPTAMLAIMSRLPESQLLGQLVPKQGPETFGILFEKGNPLRACVSRAVQELTRNLVLERLTEKWLGATSDMVPEIKVP